MSFESLLEEILVQWPGVAMLAFFGKREMDRIFDEVRKLKHDVETVDDRVDKLEIEVREILEKSGSPHG